MPRLDVSIPPTGETQTMAILSSTQRSSLTFKIFFIAFLVLLLLIPMKMIESIIYERGHLYRQAQTEITKVWGDSHTLTGPVLTVPHIRSGKDRPGWIQAMSYKHIAPDQMNITGNFDIQLRYRGIYKVPVYLAKLSLKGKFISPELLDLDLVDNVLIQIPFSQIKALKKMPELYWNGKPLALLPVREESNKEAVIFQASIALDDIGEAEFEIFYETAGSSAFKLLAWAKKTKLTMQSDWGSPSFQGDYFPTTHNIQADGFKAIWDINKIFINANDAPKEKITNEWFKDNDEFGVEFIQPADTYQLVTRSAKYAVLFISLTFMIYFLVEILGGIKLHPIQYLLIGLSNCIFYLLLLSLSEHINFNIAYFLSACSSTLLISLYSLSVLENKRKALLVFLVLTTLYVYLFITLQSAGFALVTGSIGLFVIMAILMFLTRNTDWHSLSLPEQQ
jgi:inner membrane protein